MNRTHDHYPFGQDMIGRSSAGPPVRQGYTGYWRDHEAGLNLYYAGARQYDPTTGRFFGVDPLAEDFPTWSGYTYTLNDPVRWRDPDGRWPIIVNMKLITAVVQSYLAANDFRDQYDSMIDANTIGADKYFHCMANCEASSRGTVGRVVARIISDGREITDQARNTGTDSDKDQEANRHGRAAPSRENFKDCETSCEVFLPESMKPKQKTSPSDQDNKEDGDE